MLRVRLAGGLALSSGGRDLPPPRSRRARALLAFLAAHPGPHARRQLAGRFWPDVPDEAARTSLRAALTELRGALGPEAPCLVAGRETAALEAEVDLRETAALLAAGRPAEALAACPGELLAGLDDEWVLDLRAAHDERRAEAHGALADAAEAAGDLAAAARHARAAAALDPRSAPARAREARLAAAARAGAAGRVPVPPAVQTVREAAFVGRRAELARLTGAWSAVRERRLRRIVLLAGEPGVGKTHLAMRFAASAGADGAAVLLGRCSDEALAAFEPFAEVVRALGAETARALAGDGADEVGRLLGAPAAPARGDDPGARHRLFAAVDDVLSGIAEARPLVLVLDDVHWADRPTLLLLRFVLRGTRPAPILVVGTYRDVEVGRRTPLAGALADLRREGGAERVAVRGLAVDDVAALAATRLGAPEAGRLAPAVHARTGGNAFFVEEVLRGLAEGDDAVPESVRHAVGSRLGRLGDAGEDVVAALAILGSGPAPDVEVVAEVAGRDPSEAEPALEHLLEAGLLRAGTDGALAFPHALVRDAVLADVNPLRRARLHRRAAAALSARGENEHLEEIARHLAEVGDTRAAVFLRRAGERAVEQLAYEQAAERFAAALEAVGDQAPEAGALLAARGDALLRAGGDRDGADACFAAAAERARRDGDAALLARAALGRAGLGVAIIDVDQEAIALLEEALAALGPDDPVLRSELLARLAVEHYYAPGRDRSDALSSAAVAAAREAGDPRAVAAALNARHVALWHPDGLSERLLTADAMLAAAVEAGAPDLELQARNWRVTDLYEAGDGGWRAEARRHGELAARVRLPAFMWYTPLWAAVEALYAGRYAEAAELRARAAQAGVRAGDRNAELFGEMLHFGEVLLREDWAAMNVALVEAKVAGSPAALAWRSSLAVLLAATGRAAEARAQLEVLMTDDFGRVPADANWASTIGECALAVVRLGDARLAAVLHARLLPYAGRHLTAGRAVTSFGSAQRVLAELAAAMGRRDEAIARHEAAVEANERAGMLVFAEQGRRALAALSGDPAEPPAPAAGPTAR